MEKLSQNINRKNLLQLLWLRLIAIIGQIITIVFVNYFLEISLPLREMFLVVAILAAISLVSFYRYNSNKDISDKSLFLELLFDVLALSAQLYFSGGIANPFISLFLLQVIIAAILLRKAYAIAITLATVVSYVWLVFYHVEIHEFHHHSTADFFNLHLHGMLIAYVFAAILLLIFITKIISNLREKEQLARMGIFATSAAHELSTPLSTISVILLDWKKMNLQKDVIEDILTIENQLNRCKKIISEILSSSGKERLEKAGISTVKQAFDDAVEQWQNSRNFQNLNYNFSGDLQQKIIFDDILLQAFFNIFDNAAEASPSSVQIDVNVEKNKAKITVLDRGKGFEKEILRKIGQPNISTKNSSGLGLFLASNSFNRCGADLKIKNRKDGGAQVEIIMPLQNL